MRVIDNNLLATFRQKPSCEWCGAATPTGAQPHHVRCRGIGSGSRLDIELNLLALCPTCHRKFHDGNIKRPAMLMRLSKLRGVSVKCLEDTINRLLRMPSRPVAARKEKIWTTQIRASSALNQTPTKPLPCQTENSVLESKHISSRICKQKSANGAHKRLPKKDSRGYKESLTYITGTKRGFTRGETRKDAPMHKFHPAASAFPLMEGEGFIALKQSIKDNGFLEQFPVILDQDGKIIDGRNRELASNELGIEPVYQTYSGGIASFVLAANAPRRHLSDKVKLEGIEKLLPQIRAESEARERAGRPLGASAQPPPNTRENVAKLLECGEKKAGDIIKVFEHADPSVKEAMKNRTVSVADAAAVATLPKPKQRQALRQVESGKSKTLKHAGTATQDAAAKRLAKQNGRVIPDYSKDVAECFGRLIQAVDKQARHFGCVTRHDKVEETPAHVAVRAAMKEWKEWSSEKEKGKG